jgi:hypothetical protein
VASGSSGLGGLGAARIVKKTEEEGKRATRFVFGWVLVGAHTRRSVSVASG